MNKTPEEYLSLPYTREFVRDENGMYSASIVELPGCFAVGENISEADANLDAAAESWILSELDQGREIPKPVSEESYSGKLVVRLPKSLHRQAARMASRDGTSLNTLIVMALSAWVSSKALIEPIVSSVGRLQLMESGLAATNQPPMTTQESVTVPELITRYQNFS